MKIIFTLICFVLFHQNFVFACEKLASNELNRLIDVMSSAQGEHSLNDCDIYIETKKECIQGEEQVFIGIFLTKNQETRHIPVVFSDKEQSAKILETRKGIFRLRDIDITQRPRIFEELRIRLSEDLKRINFEYEKYYKDPSSVLRKNYLDKLTCSGNLAI